MLTTYLAIELISFYSPWLSTRLLSAVFEIHSVAEVGVVLEGGAVTKTIQYLLTTKLKETVF